MVIAYLICPMTTTKHIGYNIRYRAELRYFDELGDDYIHLEFVGTTKNSAFNKALRYHKNNFKDDTAKINTFDMKHSKYGVWCIDSKIIDSLGYFNNKLSKWI